jgi:uncharacterized protein YkwD
MARDTRRSFVRTAAATIVGTATFAAGTTQASTQSTADYETQVEHAIHNRVNQIRTDHGLSPLAYNGDLADVAAYHSDDMAEREYLSHTSPEGETMSDRYERFGITCQGWGENVLFNHAANDTPAAAARQCVDQWMDSPGHRQNILSENWTAQGLGVAVTDDGRLYATQNFGANCR